MNVWLHNKKRTPILLQCSSCSCLCKLNRRLFIAYSFNFKIAGITIPFSKTDIFRTSPDCPSQKELTVFYIGYANIRMFNIYNILIHAYKIIYYSFKIFLRFWLTKITRIIHHNQLLLTKFGKFLLYRTDDVKSAVKMQVIEPLTEKTWGRVLVVFEASNGEVSGGGTFYSFQGELLSKNMAKTARR